MLLIACKDDYDCIQCVPHTRSRRSTVAAEIEDLSDVEITVLAIQL